MYLLWKEVPFCLVASFLIMCCTPCSPLAGNCVVCNVGTGPCKYFVESVGWWCNPFNGGAGKCHPSMFECDNTNDVAASVGPTTTTPIPAITHSVHCTGAVYRSTTINVGDTVSWSFAGTGGLLSLTEFVGVDGPSVFSPRSVSLVHKRIFSLLKLCWCLSPGGSLCLFPFPVADSS